MSDALLDDLGEFASEIEALPGVMRSLRLAKQKASKDPSYVQRYRVLLEQSIERIKSMRSDKLSDQELQTSVRDFLSWYDAEASARGLPAIERRRGMPHQDWMAKWFPEHWERFSRAFSHVVESGTRSSVDALRPAAIALMKAYVAEDGLRHGG